MKVHYLIQIKGANGQFGFFEAKKEKELNEFFGAFRENKNAEEMMIFRNEGLTYTLISRENKRRVGF